ncbi:TPA: phosphotransacetylase family protein, partial [Candidatus Poribacteria bacterium]|nr:phosphotransacetylase family protein [Candidatus Poribacteria bacterium]HEX29864.1 phosphotransacetylase family protein [Candidatus Poribacteria bacterium]
PKPRMQFVEEVVRPYLEKRGIAVLGVLPRERILQSVSVGELVEALDGEVLCCEEECNELVEYITVGAMTIEAALYYFRRRANKAVITGGDRPEIQLAALETPTKCLILTGNIYPSPIILSRAEELGVPIILVRHDTFTAAQLIDQVFGRSRFCQERKINLFGKLLDDQFDFRRFYDALGLPGSG